MIYIIVLAVFIKTDQITVGIVRVYIKVSASSFPHQIAKCIPDKVGRYSAYGFTYP